MKQTTLIRTVDGQKPKPRTTHHVPTRLMVNTANGSEVFPWKEIKYCEAMSNYCTIHLLDGRKIVISKTLGTLASVLPSREFFRVHQTYLVNVNSIRFVGTHEMQLEENIKILIARNRRKALLQRISEVSITL